MPELSLWKRGERMYLAILLILVGTSIYSGTISSLLVPFLFVAFINQFQIAPEEQMLEQKFGNEYLKYTKHVRRWL
jgi:protein-S-isoprenylcysteine O-methyltransferase Ste14